MTALLAARLGAEVATVDAVFAGEMIMTWTFEPAPAGTLARWLD